MSHRTGGTGARRDRFRVEAQSALIILWAVCVIPPAWSQDQAVSSGDQEKKRALQQARNYLEKFIVTDRDETKYEPLEEPLLASSDMARGELGWTWAFGRTGRPVAVMELYKSTGPEQRWLQALTLTSDHLVEARLPNGPLWSPQTLQLHLRDLPNSPPPSERSTVRQRQAKLLARRFDAHEFWDPNNSRFELRLLQTPLHTYDDEQNGIVDGAIFAFVHGTNPEVLLLIEAHRSQDQMRLWKYGLARIGSAELHVELDGEEVWHLDRAEGVVGRPIDPYWISQAPVRTE